MILRLVVSLHLFFSVICHFVDGPSSQFVSFPISWYIADNFNSILLHLIEMGFLFVTNTNPIFQNNYNVFHYAAWMIPIYIMYFYLTSPVCIIFYYLSRHFHKYVYVIKQYFMLPRRCDILYTLLSWYFPYMIDVSLSVTKMKL